MRLDTNFLQPLFASIPRERTLRFASREIIYGGANARASFLDTPKRERPPVREATEDPGGGYKVISLPRLSGPHNRYNSAA